MDDFEFPVLQGDDEHLVHPPQLAEDDDDSEAVPFHRLVGLPSDQLPKTVPKASSTGTIGDALRGIQAPKWGSASRARLPTSTAVPSAAATSVTAPSQGGSAVPSTPGPQSAAGRDGAAASNHSHCADPALGVPDISASAPGAAHRWMPTQKRQSPWSDDETDVFYDGVAQFGTNFSAVAVLLVHRTRNEVLLKYKQELQKRPDRMANALLPSQRKAVDLARLAECKQKYDALQAPPVQALNAEEEAHLLAINEELGQRSTADATAAGAAPTAIAPHARVGPSRRGDKNAGTNATAAALVGGVAGGGVAHPRTVTQPNVDRDFLFGEDDDEDVPLAELYAARRSATLHPPRSKRAGEASLSSQAASPHTASPLTNSSSVASIGVSSSGHRTKKTQFRVTESQSPVKSRAVTDESAEPQKSRRKAAGQSAARAAASSPATVDSKATASSDAAGPSQEAPSDQPARKRARTATDGPGTRRNVAPREKPVNAGSATSPSTESKQRKSRQKGPAAKSSSRRRESNGGQQSASIAEEFDFETSLTTAPSSNHATFPATLPNFADESEDNQDLVLDVVEEGWMDDDTLF